ncbi:predicted protein [Botrytis cinerea T4]|uniref:Uncharacterized protein n=1 Tax=Botryotinia fuckeliana (strain T4) TaxID=999810 RepID=G2YZ92_BOTF4|nr:predicted protein [Botrytis cinerea T4]
MQPFQGLKRSDVNPYFGLSASGCNGLCFFPPAAPTPRSLDAMSRDYTRGSGASSISIRVLLTIPLGAIIIQDYANPTIHSEVEKGGRYAAVGNSPQ